MSFNYENLEDFLASEEFVSADLAERFLDVRGDFGALVDSVLVDVLHGLQRLVLAGGPPSVLMVVDFLLRGYVAGDMEDRYRLGVDLLSEQLSLVNSMLEGLEE